MKKLSLILGMTLATSLAMAQESTSSTETTSTIEKSQVVPADKQVKDIDDELTNARMRAATGSKSKFSFRSAIGYNGGSIAKPFDRVRPAYRSARNSLTETALAASLAMKYRATERDNISAGVGLAMYTPFHNRPSEIGDRTTISDPYLTYERIYKVGDFQMVSDVSGSFTTNKESLDKYNDRGGISVSQTAILSTDYGWDIGAALSAGTTIYGDNNLDEDRVSWSLGLYPFAEYSFNDTVQFRTVFGYFNYVATRANPRNLVYETPYQSIGLGFVLTRDLYLYPNIQFVPNNISADRTNVAISANINL